MSILAATHTSVRRDIVEGFDELIIGRRRVRLPGPLFVARDQHGLPMHGLLGAHPSWSVHQADADGHAARPIARLDFAADTRLMAAFPLSSVAPGDAFTAAFTIGVS
jgi:hypothetical protein